uniref:Radiation-inducible immediate-early gene IEX-1 n=1 Tax=Amphiprion percula TaxID=161767 RepID=A0A3P8U0G2_AMPPE
MFGLFSRVEQQQQQGGSLLLLLLLLLGVSLKTQPELRHKTLRPAELRHSDSRSDRQTQKPAENQNHTEMYTRSSSTTTVQESFAFPRVASRSTEPEVFTFERIPAQATAVRSTVPLRPRKRCTRVMYPAKVRMHLPPPEKNQVKRWLLVLCLVVLWQIYTEEPCTDAPLAAADGPVGDYQGFPFQSPEEPLSSAPLSRCEDGEMIRNTCPLPGQEPDSSRGFEQSAGKSYMVALLVYHRLGSDN